GSVVRLTSRKWERIDRASWRGRAVLAAFQFSTIGVARPILSCHAIAPNRSRPLSSARGHCPGGWRQFCPAEPSRDGGLVGALSARRGHAAGGTAVAPATEPHRGPLAYPGL